MISFVSQKEAAKIDEEFFSTFCYQENQLIELAGLSVAKAVFAEYPPEKYQKVLLVCGPGSTKYHNFFVCCLLLFYLLSFFSLPLSLKTMVVMD